MRRNLYRLQVAVYNLSGKIIHDVLQLCFQTRLAMRSAVIKIMDDWRVRKMSQRVTVMKGFLPIPSELYFSQASSNTHHNYCACDQMIIDMCQLMGKSAASFADRIDVASEFVEFLVKSLLHR